MKETIRYLEQKIRPLLISIVLFSSIFLSSSKVFKILGPFTFLLIIGVVGAGYIVGKKVNIFIESFFEGFNWEEQCVIVEYRVLKRVLQSLGISILYFYVQVCIMLLFIPNFFKVTFMDAPLFLPLFCANCFLFVLFYKKFIWEEFNLTYTYQSSK